MTSRRARTWSRATPSWSRTATWRFPTNQAGATKWTKKHSSVCLPNRGIAASRSCPTAHPIGSRTSGTSMKTVSRRAFFAASAQGLAALSLRGAPPEKARIGLVASSHSKLAKPSSIEDPLDYPRVRDMVWKAIEYGRPRAGSLEAKIKPGSWVVIKPNLGSLPPKQSFSVGDTTDLRVVKAVIEYVATKSRAARITIAEGGTYRR